MILNDLYKPGSTYDMSCQQYILSVGVILEINDYLIQYYWRNVCQHLFLKYFKFAIEKVAFPAMLMKLVMLSALTSYCEPG